MMKNNTNTNTNTKTNTKTDINPNINNFTVNIYLMLNCYIRPSTAPLNFVASV